MTMIFGSSVKKGDVVSMTYVLRDEAGNEIDRADKEKPFLYLHGYGNIVVGLEKALEGAKSGDKKQVVVSPAEGYGELDDRLLLKVEKKNFPPNVQIEEGMQFETPFENSFVVFTVDKVEGDHVFINGNHPLAGVTLHFDVEILSTREASKEELAHGHVHGPGGAH